ncbi:MAG TPA: hypothetical protein VNY05_28585 [Candidatus Acidoferrales bacterium]|jgi:hypothetical protein|nr:hypothetical protein [Candidatus Acidoferrales bacterium]
MKRMSILLSASAVLAILPGIVLAQGTTGTGTFGGTVPTTFSIANTSNGSLAAALGTFGTLTIGKNVLSTPTPLAFRLRSNAGYKLTAQVGSLVGITDGAPSGVSTTLQAIKTGDIGIGFTTAVDRSGLSVVNGGASPTRTDSVVTGFDVTAGWPSVSTGHTPAFTKTLHDIFAADTQIMSGDRISASGDNSSSDNFLTVTVGVATLPQYLTPGDFSGTVTFTIAASGT